ncbi:unnamed protein product [Discula destructiva]
MSSSTTTTATMTMTVPVLPPDDGLSCCPSCGNDAATLAAAQAQIDEMHAQIRLLNAKATAAVDRWADYEDELASLRKQLTLSREREAATAAAAGRRGSSTATAPQTPTLPAANTTTTTTTNSPISPRTSSSPGMGFAAAATNRISALLSRKSTPNLKALPSHSVAAAATTSSLLLLPTPPPSSGALHQTSYSTSALPTKSPLVGFTPPSSAEDLLDALTREQQLRLAAEAKVNDTSREVEELSVSLFEEANEMVATERREKARLAARVGELEKRDREKGARLDRLECAVGRIERVRHLLGEKSAAGGRRNE